MPNTDEAVYAAKDAVTGDLYAGKVHPDLVELWSKTLDADDVLACVRQVVVNEYGDKESVWVPAPVAELPGPTPGDYRRVVLVGI